MAAKIPLQQLSLTTLSRATVCRGGSIITATTRPGRGWHLAKAQTSFITQQRRNLSLSELDRLRGDRERVVILGAGWGGYVLSRNLDHRKYQVVVVSPRPYFVFTPLLAGTTVGTLEFRNVIEPVRDRRLPHVHYMQAWGDALNLTTKSVRVEENLVDEAQKIAEAVSRFQALTKGTKQEVNVRQGTKWDVPYDKLVVAVGCYAQTFGTKGVRENAFFLKDARDARRIRSRLLECFEIASLPTTSEEMRRQLLHFAVVGGGPTGMEFSAELADMARSDMGRLYPQLRDYVKISVYDVAPYVLGGFDKSLQEYAEKTFRREGVRIRTSHHVEELRPGLPRLSDGLLLDIENTEGCYTIKTREEGECGIGLCVWSTGLAMNPFVENAVKKLRSLPARSLVSAQQNNTSPDEQWRLESHPKTHGLLVDDRLRVKLENVPTYPGVKDAKPTKHVQLKDVFAIGDNASVEGARLPATAQAANQQALWLSKRLNKGDFDKTAFTYKNMGIMTYIGGHKALIQGGNGSGDKQGPKIKGYAAWIMWRGAYVTMALSWRNKIAILFYWALNAVFGRDISRF